MKKILHKTPYYESEMVVSVMEFIEQRISDHITYNSGQLEEIQNKLEQVTEILGRCIQVMVEKNFFIPDELYYIVKGFNMDKNDEEMELIEFIEE